VLLRAAAFHIISQMFVKWCTLLCVIYLLGFGASELLYCCVCMLILLSSSATDALVYNLLYEALCVDLG
jgi:hypothetical protein